MGLRSKLKGALKRAIVGGPDGAQSAPHPTPAPAPVAQDAAEPGSHGNLSGGEDVPWYLKDGDADGWDSTNAKDTLDED